MTAGDVIEALGLIPLSGEGGMYRSLYKGRINDRGIAAYSSIYYFLTGKAFSHMHRLKTDEIYHYYIGDGLELLLLYPDGRAECKTVGSRILEGESPQLLVPAGVWQGSLVANPLKSRPEGSLSIRPEGSLSIRPDSPSGYCLVGTTMAPAYRPEDYEHGSMEGLCEAYPEAEKEIKRRCGAVMDK